MIRENVMSADAFREFAELPENADRMFELINGEIIEVSPGRTSNSQIGHILAFMVRGYCQQQGLPCYTCGGDGGFDVQGNVVAPDFAYKTTPMMDEYPDPVPPLWAVEVISPTDKAPEIRAKRQIYLDAGILYWEIYPQLQRVDVYAPDKPMRMAAIGENLDGSIVLPGLSLPVGDLFAR